MVKRKIKLDLEQKIKELKLNLENNYKDLAQDALRELQATIEGYKESGDLKEKDYRKYKQIAEDYAMGMINYRH